ncbi:MFS transporter [Pseudonocardia kunmingensis]|uniref:EmrB/QacA subfamily drug resistance transporter n=1 Tax=Pseudonocardia kunmingensis TaxID=630975 RepID=A0A543DRM0_9PSEU|nr:MFS transporter [Pseudonocardia kunmingensis]TQM11980.1 EmrB/QacA subfamily drug resistance transporter [Pseudonocardia kunmingensis]
MTTTRPVRPGAITAVVLCGAVLGPLNSTMIAVALPPMASDLRVDAATMSWLVTAYLITMAALQPVAGKLGDRLGPRPVLLTGYALFFLASALAAFVHSLPLLVACRVAQAVAGALLAPTGLALLRRCAPPDRLGRAFGVVGAVLPLAAAVGPVLGGVLVEFGGWPAIFLVNLPVTLFALVLGWWVVPHAARRDGGGGFDVVGAGGLCALLVGLTVLLDTAPGGAVLVVACLVLALATWAFVRHERRHPDAVLPPRLFTRRSFVAAAAGIGLSNLAFYVTLLAVPLLLHDRGIDGAQAGLVLGALTLASSPLAVLGGRLADRAGLRLPAVTGLVLVLAGLVPLVLDPSGVPLPLLVAALAVMGAGVGLSMPPFQLGALHDVAQHDTGMATGVFFTSRYLGSVAGASLLAGPLAPTSAGAETLLFGVLAVAAALGVAAAATLPGRTAEAPGPQRRGVA